MAASVNDKFRLASGSTRPLVTTLSLPKAAGATTAELTVATGWNTTTGLDYVMYRRQLNTRTGLYEEIARTRVEGRAVLTGTTLSSMTFDAGTEPVAGYAADGNTVVLCAATAQWADDLVGALLEEHNQDGTHDATTVAMLAGAQTITGNKTFSGVSDFTGELRVDGVNMADAWASYIPTFTNFTLGDGTITYAKWKQVGKTASYRGRVVLGSTSSMGGSPLRISLPVNAATDYNSEDMAGVASILDSGSNVWPGFSHIASATTLGIRIMATQTGANPVFVVYRDIAAGTPITYGTSDAFQWEITYETP